MVKSLSTNIGIVLEAGEIRGDVVGQQALNILYIGEQEMWTHHSQRKKKNEDNLVILAPFPPATHEVDVPDFYENVSPDDPKHGIYAGVNVENVDISSRDSSQDRNIAQWRSSNHQNITSPRSTEDFSQSEQNHLVRNDFTPGGRVIHRPLNTILSPMNAQNNSQINVSQSDSAAPGKYNKESKYF